MPPLNVAFQLYVRWWRRASRCWLPLEGFPAHRSADAQPDWHLDFPPSSSARCKAEKSKNAPIAYLHRLPFRRRAGFFAAFFFRFGRCVSADPARRRISFALSEEGLFSARDASLPMPLLVRSFVAMAIFLRILRRTFRFR